MPRPKGRKHRPRHTRDTLGVDARIKEITDYLSPDGTPSLLSDWKKRAKDAGVAERTFWTYLDLAKGKGKPRREPVIIEGAAIVDGKKAKTYALDIARLFRSSGDMKRKLDEVLSSLPSSDPALSLLPDQDRRRLYLETHLDSLKLLTAIALFNAAEAETKDQANRLAEIVVDFVLRGYLRDLSGSVWETRKESADVLRTILADKGLRQKAMWPSPP